MSKSIFILVTDKKIKRSHQSWMSMTGNTILLNICIWKRSDCHFCKKKYAYIEVNAPSHIHSYNIQTTKLVWQIKLCHHQVQFHKIIQETWFFSHWPLRCWTFWCTVCKICPRYPWDLWVIVPIAGLHHQYQILFDSRIDKDSITTVMIYILYWGQLSLLEF